MQTFAENLDHEWGGGVDDQLRLIKEDPYRVPCGSWDKFQMFADIVNMEFIVQAGGEEYLASLSEDDLEYCTSEEFFDWACEILA